MERNRANLSVKKGINYFFTSEICFDFLLKLFCCRCFAGDITACHIILLFVRRRGVQFAFYQKGNYGNCSARSGPLCHSPSGSVRVAAHSAIRVQLALHALGSSRTRLFMHSALHALGFSCARLFVSLLFAYSALRVLGSSCIVAFPGRFRCFNLETCSHRQSF